MRPPASSKQRLRAFLKTPFASRDGSAGVSADADGQQKPVDKARRKGFLRDYRAWLWPFRWVLLTLFLLALASAGLDMIWPLAIRHIIDGVLLKGAMPPGAKERMLGIFGVGIIVILVSKQAIDSLRSYRTAVMNATLLQQLRKRLYSRFLGLPLGTLSDFKTGGIVSRLSSDVEATSGLVQMALLSPGVACIRVILTVSVLLVISWRLAIGALLTMPPMAVVSYLWLRRVRPIYRSNHQERAEIDARVTETFGGIRVVRSFRREPREQKRYATDQHTRMRKGLYAQRLELVLDAVWGLLVPGASLVIVWYGGFLVLRGLAQVGDIFLFQVYAVLLLQPVWQIVSSVSQTQKSLAAMERVFDVLRMPLDKPDATDAIDADSQVRQIRFEDLSFEYRPGTPVVRHINLEVAGGSVVALVGPSGAGKTTLTDLVARFYDPTSGSISLNGVDLRKLKLASYRRLLAVVPQDVFLFDGTVRQNIAYGRHAVSDAQVQDAARRANAHEFIEKLPDGYDTLIGERGFKLSGGQRQRLSIARAILADPQILILDEATSNLDTESEQLIQASLAELFRGRTTFVIAHRLSTVTHADMIVVMDQGQIREIGTHEELMRQRGFYCAMVERQQQSLDRMAGDLV